MFNKYMIIGSVPSKVEESYGGTTVLVKQLLDYFDEQEFSYVLIQTNKYYGRLSRFKNYIYTILNYIRYVKSTDIIFVNVASNGVYFISPILLFLSKKLNKKFISRNFGGNTIELYNSKNKIKSFLIHYLVKESDILFFETKYLVDYFKRININSFWFPNTRKKPCISRDKKKQYKKNFVFVVHIKKEKGIEEILIASKFLDNNYTITLYGSIIDEEYTKEILEGYDNIYYKGPVIHEEIYSTLIQYDVLILPSHREGYPGVVIEAFGMGLPVITTKLDSLKEMVNDKSGILVEVEDYKALVKAIKSFNSNNYSNFSKHALINFQNFDLDIVYERVINICEKAS